MHITINAIGTRGDVQPILALGTGLKAAGHAVRIIAGGNFGAWVRAHGFDFAPSIDMVEFMSSPDAIAWVESGGNPYKQMQNMKTVLRRTAEELYQPILSHARDTDLMLSGFISQPFVQTICEKYDIPYISLLLQPYPATRSYAATLIAATKRDSVLNYAFGTMSERVMYNVGRESVNGLRTRLQMRPHNFKSYRGYQHHAPTIFGFSRHVVPQPEDWRDNAHIAGYWFWNEDDWQPPADLTHFINAGAPPVYVGFGSMSVSDPNATFRLVCEALKRAGRRGVVATGWSGATLETVPDHVYALDKAPHGWLFPRMAGVVHHGGAGTTGAGVRAGVPSLVIPHMTDQPYWGRRMHDLGVGVKPIPRHKLTLENLTAALIKLTTDTTIRERAARLGELVRAEDGVAEAVRLIERYGR